MLQNSVVRYNIINAISNHAETALVTCTLYPVKWHGKRLDIIKTQELITINYQ